MGNKVGGINGILAEMIKVCTDELLMYLFDLFGIVGLFLRSGEVPVPKKRDLSPCDNCWGNQSA